MLAWRGITRTRSMALQIAYRLLHGASTRYEREPPRLARCLYQLATLFCQRDDSRIISSVHYCISFSVRTYPSRSFGRVACRMVCGGASGRVAENVEASATVGKADWTGAARTGTTRAADPIRTTGTAGTGDERQNLICNNNNRCPTVKRWR